MPGKGPLQSKGREFVGQTQSAAAAMQAAKARNTKTVRALISAEITTGRSPHLQESCFYYAASLIMLKTHTRPSAVRRRDRARFCKRDSLGTKLLNRWA